MKIKNKQEVNPVIPQDCADCKKTFFSLQTKISAVHINSCIYQVLTKPALLLGSFELISNISMLTYLQ